MRAFLISCFFILFTPSLAAQATESHNPIEKNSSKRLSLSKTELDLLKIKFMQTTDTILKSEGFISKNPTNRLWISEIELDAFKDRFIFTEEIADKITNRKQIASDHEVIDFFQKNNNIE